MSVRHREKLLTSLGNHGRLRKNWRDPYAAKDHPFTHSYYYIHTSCSELRSRKSCPLRRRSTRGQRERCVIRTIVKSCAVSLYHLVARLALRSYEVLKRMVLKQEVFTLTELCFIDFLLLHNGLYPILTRASQTDVRTTNLFDFFNSLEFQVRQVRL